MSELAFIRENIQNLKMEYGSSLQLSRRVFGVFNPKLGRQDYTAIEITIPLAIRLPNQITFEFLQSIGANIKALEILAGTIQLLIDLDDVAGYDLRSPDISAIYGGRTYTVAKSEVYDYAAILWAKDVGAVPVSNRVGQNDRLQFSHRVDVTVT